MASKALVKAPRKSRMTGVVPAVASGFVPGLGQLLNGETEKAIGVFVVAGVAGTSLLGAIPLIGSVAGIVWGATWVYGVADGYFGARKERKKKK